MVFKVTKREIISKMKGVMGPRSSGGTASITFCDVYTDHEGKTVICAERSNSRSCHSGMSYALMELKQAVGSNFNQKVGPFPGYGEAYDSFVNFILSEKSPYNPLIKSLGDRFYVTGGDKISGFFVLMSKGESLPDTRLIMNLFKSTRTTGEHNERLKFWKKWHMEKGMPGGLTYLLMYCFDVNGSKSCSGHAPIESHIFGSIDLEKFLDPNHDKWNLSPIKRTVFNYEGENTFTWRGGKFDPYKIPRTKEKGADTRFYKKYYCKPINVWGDEDIEAFWKSLEKKGRIK